MRFEQRICDYCGRQSELVRVSEPDESTLRPLASMAQLGWTIVGDRDRCPSCTWTEAQP